MIDYIKIVDDSRYVSGKSHNGGGYRFTETYRRNDDGTYSVTYGTSADFAYCPFCGNFIQGECPCGYEEPRKVSADEVLETVLDSLNREDMWLEWDYRRHIPVEDEDEEEEDYEDYDDIGEE